MTGQKEPAWKKKHKRRPKPKQKKEEAPGIRNYNPLYETVDHISPEDQKRFQEALKELEEEDKGRPTVEQEAQALSDYFISRGMELPPPPEHIVVISGLRAKRTDAIAAGDLAEVKRIDAEEVAYIRKRQRETASSSTKPVGGLYGIHAYK